LLPFGPSEDLKHPTFRRPFHHWTVSTDISSNIQTFRPSNLPTSSRQLAPLCAGVPGPGQGGGGAHAGQRALQGPEVSRGSGAVHRGRGAWPGG